MGKLWPTNIAFVNFGISLSPFDHQHCNDPDVQITRRLGDPVVCETQPGDCLFFHRLDLSIIIRSSIIGYNLEDIEDSKYC